MAKPRPAEKPKHKFLTAKQVADRYGQSLKWVYGCLTLPRRKVGKYLVFREGELEEFEKSWQKATPSYRTYQTKKELGISASHNGWVFPPEKLGEERREFKLLFTIE